MNIRLSLKTQLTIFLLVFILILISQIYFAKSNQSGLIDTFSNYQKTIDEEKLVRELERDVLDLQRQVLVFKDTGSASSVKRFNALIIEVKSRLTQIKSSQLGTSASEDTLATLSAMQQHIEDYEDNFETVVNGRQQRDIYLEEGLLVSIETLLSSQLFISFVEKNGALRTQVYSAEKLAYRYLLSPNSTSKKQVSEKLNTAIAMIQEINAPPKDKDTIQESILNVNQQFIKLTNLTQGYIYLVNVVMAGSANEFLYLSHAISTESARLAAITNAKIAVTIDESQRKMNTSSLVGILITLILAIFTANRIFRPLSAITDVFERLVKGEANVTIPYTQRKDEIGKLASAGSVFNTKNQQTKDLLEQSQELNSQQKALNEKLAEAKQQAENANASKGLFLANMSHEIRTPLIGIIGLVDISLQKNMPAQIRENLTRVAYSSQILMNVINDILDFSKIEAGKLELEKRPFSFSHLFNNLPAFTNISASEKRLNVEIYVDPILPVKAIGDPLRISQVILNLTNNAIKFTQKGKVKVSFLMRTCAEKDAFHLEVQVQDTGIGLDEDTLESIFKPFMQADNSTSRKFGGTGLGLSIVKQLTSLMEGEVNATSQEGIGSIFICTFKLLKYELPKGTEILQHARYHVIYLATPEQKLYPEYVKQISSSFDYKSLENTEEWLPQLSSEQIVLIDIEPLADIEPIAEVIKQLRSAGIPFGCITASQPIELNEELQKKWCCPFLIHPYTPTDVDNFLSNIASKDGQQGESSESVIGPLNADTKMALKGHVLIVEDNLINQILLGEMLKSYELTYQLAQDGKDAIEQLACSKSVDLILMDIQMPILDGLAATRHIRHHGDTSTPIIGVSANAMQEDHDLAIESGMNDYLTKPINSHALYKMLEKYLPV